MCMYINIYKYMCMYVKCIVLQNGKQSLDNHHKMKSIAMFKMPTLHPKC